MLAKIAKVWLPHNGTRIAGQGLVEKPSALFAQEGTPDGAIQAQVVMFRHLGTTSQLLARVASTVQGMDWQLSSETIPPRSHDDATA